MGATVYTATSDAAHPVVLPEHQSLSFAPDASDEGSGIELQSDQTFAGPDLIEEPLDSAELTAADVDLGLEIGAALAQLAAESGLDDESAESTLVDDPEPVERLVEAVAHAAPIIEEPAVSDSAVQEGETNALADIELPFGEFAPDIDLGNVQTVGAVPVTSVDVEPNREPGSALDTVGTDEQREVAGSVEPVPGGRPLPDMSVVTTRVPLRNSSDSSNQTIDQDLLEESDYHAISVADSFTENSLPDSIDEKSSAAILAVAKEVPIVTSAQSQLVLRDSETLPVQTESSRLGLIPRIVNRLVRYAKSAYAQCRRWWRRE